MRVRDTKTGRFASATTWKRSRAHGGTRYRRIAVRTGTRKRAGYQRTVRPATFPTETQIFKDMTGGGLVRGPDGKVQDVPQEFLDEDYYDEYFEAGYEADEEDEY